MKPEEQNTAEASAGTKTKVCKKCGRELPVSEFSSHGKSKDGLWPYCKDCMKEVVREATRKRSLKRNLPESVNPKEVMKIADHLREDRLRKEKAVPAETPETTEEALKRFTDTEIIDELRRRGFTGTISITL